MILPMTKYSFVLLSSGKEEFLGKLQELGLLDVTRSSKPIDEYSTGLLDKAGELRRHIADIEKDNFNRDPEYVRLCESLASEKKDYASRLPWGEFDRKAIDGLAEKGLRMHFYSVPEKKFDPAWAELQPLEVISREDGTVWFVTVAPEAGYSFPVAEIEGPAGTAGECFEAMERTREAIALRKKTLSDEKKDIPALKEEYAGLLNELDLHLAKASGESAAEQMLTLIQAFAPTENDAAVKEALDGMDGVYYMAEPATKEDNPPIKLRNNWFARQFETLTGMYGMPLYDEWDPTPVLAPFFLLFFALCMGDGGYGLLLIAIAYALKGCKGEGPMGLAKHWRLIRFLGIGTFVVGMFLGTFFGISLADAAWFPESLKKYLLVGNIGKFPLQMVLALAIGVFHICLAMVIKSLLYTKRFGFKENISTWGWTLLIVGGLIAFIVAAVAGLPADVTKWIIIGIAAVSALAIFIFNKPGRNPLLNVGAGLWDTYQMATGILGDVLSYIRLYALGLAGGMLGGAFNTLGGMVLGDHPTFQWVFFLIIVVLGHALNLAMSCLGAFVHPLRLSFVEYFKNSGYEGKGTGFNPFRKTVKE